MHEGFVTVARPKDEVTANIIRGALEAQGIEAVVQPFHSAVFDGIFTNAEGAWGEVLVREKDAEQARAILTDHTGSEREQ